ncbi:MAG: fasciclin domain-containing protein [Planctomycetota bacterium]
MKKIASILTVAIALLISSISTAQQKTIVETAIAAGNFDTLVTAVKAAGLVDTLNGHKMFTVFAPTDEAFASFDQTTLQTLLKPENKGQLTDVLTYHVLSGRVNARDAYDLNSTATVNGQRLPLNFRGDRLTVGGANIVVTDIQCSNGVIHVIDSVLVPKFDSIPATAQAAGQFNTLLAAVGAAGLADTLSGTGPFTVFAPTDEAFAKLPAGTVESLLKPENKQKLIDILKYHVISGRIYDNDAVRARTANTLLGRSVDVNFSADGIAINNAKVIAKNIDTTNGVIHIIDSVLLPKSMTRTAAMNFLNDTVNRGAPVYNAGDHSGCCDIYMTSMKSIMSSGIANADDHTMSLVSRAINDANNTHSSTDRAWVLRRGIDSLYTRLDNMTNQMPTEMRTSR